MGQLLLCLGTHDDVVNEQQHLAVAPPALDRFLLFQQLGHKLVVPLGEEEPVVPVLVQKGFEYRITRRASHHAYHQIKLI